MKVKGRSAGPVSDSLAADRVGALAHWRGPVKPKYSCVARSVAASVCLLAGAGLLCDRLPAQEVTAGITGRVTDPSDAPIANATVRATDTARGTVFTATTNQDGAYTISRLPIGTYEVRVEAPGFQTAVHPPVQLELNQTSRLDFPMRVGQLTETVEVTGDAPLLQTETTQLGTVINALTNVNLPLASRNYVQLTLLAPGSVNPNPGSMTSGDVSVNSGRPYVNGNREQANNFLLDGMDNNQVSDNLVGYTPSPDAIQEFNMITNNAPAEFGNFQGGIISVSIKSGTNEFHGSAFEFFRNDKLNANDWAANWNGSPRAKLRWNMFGGSVGGPIAKNKLFFFADYQGQRFNRPASTGTISVFTAEERRGDFSRLLTEKGVQLYNPFSVTAGNRAPFPNNQIPITLIDPVAQRLFASPLYPLPINNQLQNNYFNTTQSQVHADQGDLKIDANISEKDRFFARYSRSQQDSPSINSFPLFFGSFFEAPTHNGVIDWTRTLTPSIVNEFRAGINYVKVHNGGADNGLGNVAQDLGITGGNERGPGLFSVGFGAALVNGIGSANIGTQQLFADTVLQVGDTAVISVGRHVVHTGFQFWRQRINTFYAGNNGRTGLMEFNGKFTAGPAAGAVAGGGAGAGEADFFLGLPERIGRGVNSGTWGQRANIIAAYVQDTFRITPTLTLNYGLRYETHTPWHEVFDRQSNFAPFSGEIQIAGKSSYYGDNRALYNPYNGGLDFQPRFGFAWTPGGRGFVVRGAYTISSYLEGTGTNLRLPLNPPFNAEFETRYSSLTLPQSRTSQGLTVLTSAADPFAGATIRLWDPNIRPAAVQQWNLSLQQQFGQNTTLQVGYVGQTGTHLMVPMPYFQRRLLSNGTTEASPYLSGNPALKSIAQISGTESNGNQRYDALQATLLKRFSDGLQYQVAYTYSKCMTNSSGYYGSWGGQAVPTSPYWQNLYDMKAEWGPCYYDVTHVLTSYAVYDLPIGRGKRIGKDMPRVADAVIGNWQMSGILTLRGGFPLTISGGDASGTNSRGPRGNCVAPPQVFGRRNSPSGGYQWFDPNSYAPPAPGTFGTCGVGTVRGPGLTTLDFSLMKEIPIAERKRLEFRGEFLNFTNTPILGAPNTGLGASLGLLQGSQGPRNVQLALKLYF
jgi:hypothetical protein